jgi:hypothetical protein
MPLYTFELRAGSAPLFDSAGVHLPGRPHAVAYAREVARELMHGREAQTRSWRLDVYEDHGEQVCGLTFAAVDRTLDHLAPELRSSVERLSNSYRSWRDTVYAAQATMRESRALVAQARAKPYLVANAGRRTIR